MSKIFLKGISLQICLISILYGYAQQKSKPALDTAVFRSWPHLAFYPQEPVISNDGRFICYSMANVPAGSYTVMIQDTRGTFKKEFVEGGNAVFTEDNTAVILAGRGDTLYVQRLQGAGPAYYVPNVLKFRLIDGAKKSILAYLTHDRKLILQDMKSTHHQNFEGVTDFYVLPAERSLILVRSAKGQDSGAKRISLVSLTDLKEDLIWEGTGDVSFIFHKAGQQAAFTVTPHDNKTDGSSIWYFSQSKPHAVPLVDAKHGNVERGYYAQPFDGNCRFTGDGKRIYFSVGKIPENKRPKGLAEVDVWSYTDLKLQSYQLTHPALSAFGAVLGISTGRIIRLQHDDEQLSLLPGADDKIAYVKYNPVNEMWRGRDVTRHFIVSTITGERKEIAWTPVPETHAALSPGGRYLLLTDEEHTAFHSYDVQRDSVINIAKNTLFPFEPVDDDIHNPYKRKDFKVAAWLDDNRSLLIYDKYDVWKFDATGKNAPVCLTNQFGRKHHISLRLLEESTYAAVNRGINTAIRNTDRLLLNAFNRVTMENGFFEMRLDKASDPTLLTMSSNVFYDPGDWQTNSSGIKPVKAKNAKVWLTGRESCKASLNLFITDDFKNFVPVTDNYPEKKYNWVTSRIMEFKAVNGEKGIGVLYMPEDFDSTKKYPVILHYYEKTAQWANAYKMPEGVWGYIDIPWFVSRGYLVFTPNIRYTWGYPGESVYNDVVGAAESLSQFPWIDGKRMGIQGHSFGGFETNTLLTRTGLFAAAMASSGVSDLVSDNLSVTLDGWNKLNFSQNRIQETPWENVDRFIENSPVLSAHKITTPLLLMNNKLDGIINFNQGVEFMVAMRRLGKRAWMLQYDDEAHVVVGDNNKKDLTMRVTQFFDHYLKDSLPPKWMTRGIPAKMKGIDDGLELDYEIKTPPDGGLLTDDEKKKVDALQHRKPVTVTIE